MKQFSVDLKDYPAGGTVFHRTAVRGIVQNGGLFLLVTNKFGDYKFPGGGMEPGEMPEETLSRELREETGYEMAPGSLRQYAAVKELRRGMTADILEMENLYYFCEVQGEPAPLSLDDYEAEEEFRAEWVALPEALRKNRKAAKENKNPWVLREIRVMECLEQEN